MASYYYDAFGVHKTVTGTVATPYRYSGYMFDEETGLYYLKSRYYDPETARFLSEDTYRGEAGDPLSLNLYAYVKYNPLKYYDPTGHIISATDSANLSSAQQQQLAQYTAAYNKAKADNNAAGMKAANDAANAVRATAGYSGGTNGISINVSSGNTVNTVVLNNSQTTLNNNGTVNTVNVSKNSTSTITNNGIIVTINNSGNSTVHNNGSM